MLYRICYTICLCVLLAACGGSTSSDADAKKDAAPAAKGADDKVMEIVIEGNDLMQFNMKEIQVFAGYTIKLTLKHTGQLPKASMGHNWVLVNIGTVLSEFAMNAITAVDTDYIPQDAGDQIIAHTKLLGGGEEDTIEFEAPAVGTYDYVCTFPGHWAVMQGKLIVSEAE